MGVFNFVKKIEDFVFSLFMGEIFDDFSFDFVEWCGLCGNYFYDIDDDCCEVFINNVIGFVGS